MDKEPASPFTELAAGAAQLHELFVTLCKSGFTKRQALYLVAEMTRQRPEV